MTDLPIYQESLFFGWGEPPHNIDWVPLRALVVVALASALQVAQSAVVHLEGHRKLMTLVKILHSKGRLPKGLGEFLGIYVFMVFDVQVLLAVDVFPSEGSWERVVLTVTLFLCGQCGCCVLCKALRLD